MLICLMQAWDEPMVVNVVLEGSFDQKNKVRRGDRCDQRHSKGESSD